jgi:hypothetical protein
LFLPLALLGQGPVPQAQAVAPPRLEITPKGRIALGSVGPRETKTLAYTFRNISPMPIALRVGDLSPGVTVQGPALEKPIGPNQSASLSMFLDPTDSLGVQRRSVRLLTDDPKQGAYLLPVEMTVRPDLTVDQERKSFGTIGTHESPQIGFAFTRESGIPLQVRLITPLPEYLEQEVVAGSKTAELRFTFRPGKVEPGTLLGLETLVVEANAPLQSRFTLYLDWKLRRPVEAIPSRLVFLEAAVQGLDLSLKRQDGQPFAIQSALIEGKGFALQSLPTGPGPEHQLRVLRTGNSQAKALLILHFEGQEESLAVPLAYLPSLPPTPAK